MKDGTCEFPGKHPRKNLETALSVFQHVLLDDFCGGGVRTGKTSMVVSNFEDNSLKHFGMRRH